MTLSELIMTRVSHDLAGICGALYNTAELLEIDDTFGTDAGPLIKTSTGALITRLKFFRALFGLDGAPLNNDIADKYLKTLSAPFELSGQVQTRMQLAGILICGDVMMRGGKIQITSDGVTGVGGIKVSEELTSVLKGKIDTVEPKTAPIVWLYQYAREHCASVEVTVSSDRLDIRF